MGACRLPLPTLACLLLLAALLAPPAAAAVQEYRIDPLHTRIVFRVDHAGFSRSMGSFSRIEGWLRFDPDDPTTAALDVRIPLASLDLGDADWNRAMLRPAWLDAERHPQARFVAERVEAGEDGLLQVHGRLSLRGQTRPLLLAARLNAHRRNPLTLRRTVGFSATATLQRSDFGMDQWARLVGDTVELWIELEAVRQRGSQDIGPEPAENDHAPAQ